MYAGEVLGRIEGLTRNQLNSWDGYIRPKTIRHGMLNWCDYTEEDVEIIKTMLMYHGRGKLPAAAYRMALQELKREPKQREIVHELTEETTVPPEGLVDRVRILERDVVAVKSRLNRLEIGITQQQRPNVATIEIVYLPLDPWD